MKRSVVFILFCIQQAVFGQVDLKAMKSNLIGRWDWKSTTYQDPSGPTYSTPSTCHCIKYLVFEKNDVIKAYRNDTLISSGTYFLEEHNFMNDPVKIMMRSSLIVGEIQLNDDSFAIGLFGGCGGIDAYRRHIN